jgi:hypothetical protein
MLGFRISASAAHPGLRRPLPRDDFGTGLVYGASADGRWEELRLFRPPAAATRQPQPATIRRSATISRDSAFSAATPKTEQPHFLINRSAILRAFAPVANAKPRPLRSRELDSAPTPPDIGRMNHNSPDLGALG